jgi:hypothetical protein
LTSKNYQIPIYWHLKCCIFGRIGNKRVQEDINILTGAERRSKEAMKRSFKKALLFEGFLAGSILLYYS